MAKFKPSLIDKVKEEYQKEERQNKLRMEAGITDQTVMVKEKGSSDYGKAVIWVIIYTILIILAFLGVLMVLNPESREVLTEIFYAA